MKCCTKCQIEKEISEFHRDSHTPDGFTHQCKACRTSKMKEQRKAGAYKVDREAARAFQLLNRDKYNKNRREKAKADPEVREKKYAAQKQWRKSNPEKARSSANNYKRLRWHSDPLFAYRNRIACLISMYLKKGGWKKKSKTQDIIGCDFATFEAHLILSAMKNYGMWLDSEPYHIDHIKPVSLATTEAELIQLNHYLNLQLLTPEDNLRKSDSYYTAPSTTESQPDIQACI